MPQIELKIGKENTWLIYNLIFVLSHTSHATVICLISFCIGMINHKSIAYQIVCISYELMAYHMNSV